MRTTGLIFVGALLVLNSCGTKPSEPSANAPTPSYSILDECPYPARGGLAAVLHDPALVVGDGVITSIAVETQHKNIYGEYRGSAIQLEAVSGQSPSHVVLTERISEPAGAATAIDLGSLRSGQEAILLSHSDKGEPPIAMAVVVVDQAGRTSFPGRCDAQFRQEIQSVLAEVDSTKGLSEADALRAWLDLIAAGGDDVQFIAATSGTGSAGAEWADQSASTRSLAPDAVPESIRPQIDVRAVFFEVEDASGQTLSVSTLSGVSAASMVLDGTVPSEAFFIAGVDGTFRVHVADASGVAQSTRVLVVLPIGELPSAAGYLVKGSLASGSLSYTSLSLEDVAKRLGLTTDQVLAARKQALTVSADGG